MTAPHAVDDKFLLGITRRFCTFSIIAREKFYFMKNEREDEMRRKDDQETHMYRTNSLEMTVIFYLRASIFIKEKFIISDFYNVPSQKSLNKTCEPNLSNLRNLITSVRRDINSAVKYHCSVSKIALHRTGYQPMTQETECLNANLFMSHKNSLLSSLMSSSLTDKSRCQPTSPGPVYFAANLSMNHNNTCLLYTSPSPRD